MPVQQIKVAGVDYIYLNIPAATSIGNFVFTGNNVDLTAAGALGIGNIGPTATSIVFGPATLSLAANSVLTAAASLTNTTGFTVTSNVADGATSIAFLLNNTTALANAGSFLVSIQNAGAAKWTLGPTGVQTIYNDIVVGAGSPKAGTLAAPMGTIATPAIDSGTGNALSLTGRQANATDAAGTASGSVGIGTLTLNSIGAKALSFSIGSNAFGIGTASGDATFQGLYSRQMTADVNGTTISKLVVFSGALKVQIAGLTANLTTVAGVALGTRTNGQSVNVMCLGPCLVSADAGIVAGDILVSSSAVAGNVMTNAASIATFPIGSLVGRAMEATGATVAGKVYVDLFV